MLFDGTIMLNCNDGKTIEMTVNVPSVVEGQEDQGPQPVSFNLNFDLGQFNHLHRQLANYEFMVRSPGNQEAIVPGGEDPLRDPDVSSLPLDEEGTCPKCDSHQGIQAKGVVRTCGNCEYRWRVR